MSHLEGQREKARLGLQAWAGFPVGQQPRPLVLLRGPALPGGFPDVQTKMAFLHGAIEAAPGFPEPVLQVLRGKQKPHDRAPLLVTTATLGSTEYCTDRGRLQLPAWEVRARNVPEPIWVLEPATLRQAWKPPGHDVPGWRSSTAVLDADGRTISIWMDYTGVDVLESGAAVALLPRPVEKTTSGGGGFRSGFVQGRQIIVVLARPLGNRVTLDEAGAPVMVRTDL